MMEHPTGAQLYGYLDGDLAADERQAVGRHLEGCSACRREVELGRGIEKASRRVVARPSAGFTDALMTRLLTEAPETSAAAASAARPDTRRFIVPGTLVAIYLTAMLVVGLGSHGGDGEGGSGWVAEALALLDSMIGHIGDLARTMMGGSYGLVLVAVTAVVGLIAIDSLVGRRIPRGRH